MADLRLGVGKEIHMKVERSARIKSAIMRSIYLDENSIPSNIKIAIMGAHNSGATSVVDRYISNTYTDCTPPHMGLHFHVKNLLVNSKKYKLQIFDMNDCGARRSNLAYMRSAVLVLLVFDIHEKSSYKSICEYVGDVKHHLFGMTEIHPIILIGNKLDVAENERAISYKEGLQFVEENNLLAYFECSAKTNIGIDSVFEMVEQFIAAYVCKLQNSCAASAKDSVVPMIKK